jgi:epoxyqueuosine reductase QueG
MAVSAVALSSEQVKAAARALGADLVGIASCADLEANPPDPAVPQVPSRIMPEARSCIVVAKRTPLGTFLSTNAPCISTTNQLVMRWLEKASLKLVYWLEERGAYALQLASEETDPELKRGSYGWLSLRHLAVWAGLGTMGLEWNLLTREYGPRVYFAAVLTSAELTPDARISDQLCIGPSCGRCLLSCPPDAILHWGLDKRRCATAAQIHGVSSILHGPVEGLAEAPDGEAAATVLAATNTRRKYLSMVRLAESFAACPRCVEVCPVGEDYKRYLAVEHKEIPETTDDKLVRLKVIRASERVGELAPGSKPIDRRWIGEAGYRPRRRASAASADPADA